MNPNALTPSTPEGAPFERRDFIVSTYKHLGAAILAQPVGERCGDLG